MDELKQKLLEACNNSGLPLEAIYYVVKDLYRDIDETLSVYKESIKNAQVEENKEEEK